MVVARRLIGKRQGSVLKMLDEKDWDVPFVNNDIPQFLRVLRGWHHDSEFEVRFVAIDSLGQRKTKLFSEQ
jgi:hypothetical protein